MPDPQSASGTAVEVGTWAAGFVAAAGALVLGMKRLGSAVKQMTASDTFIEDQTKFRQALHAEMDALRARVSTLEDELRRAQDESLLYKRRFIEVSSELGVVKTELERCRETWDPERTLPPRLG